jgi:hypothetical protein
MPDRLDRILARRVAALGGRAFAQTFAIPVQRPARRQDRPAPVGETVDKNRALARRM